MDAKTLLERLFPGGCDDRLRRHLLLRDRALRRHRRRRDRHRGQHPHRHRTGLPHGAARCWRWCAIIPADPSCCWWIPRASGCSHRDELLGINGYMAHLAKCIDLARRSGHRILGLVYSHAVSGGFLASSMLADICYALPEAEIRVMNLPAMARVTKIPLERLTELSACLAGVRAGGRQLPAHGRHRGAVGGRPGGLPGQGPGGSGLRRPPSGRR